MTDTILTQEQAEDILLKYYEGITGAMPATELGSNKNKAIAIVGPPKSGKSWAACTIAEAVGVTYVADLDNRAESIKGKKNIIVKTYVDEEQIRPHAWNELEKDVAYFKYQKVNGKPIPAAFIIDSLTFLQEITDNQFFVTLQPGGKTKLFREIRVGNKVVRIAEGWDIRNATRSYIYHLFAELRNLGHLIVVFHERPIADKTLSTPERTVYSGKIGVNPPFLNELLSVFNDVWRISYSIAGGYRLQVRSNDEFDGACTFDGAGLTEEANIAKMMNKQLQLK